MTDGDTSPLELEQLDRVIIAPAQKHPKTVHIPGESDSATPKCKGETHSSWRTVSKDHPATRDKRLCKNCANARECPDEYDTSHLASLKRAAAEGGLEAENA